MQPVQSVTVRGRRRSSHSSTSTAWAAARTGITYPRRPRASNAVRPPRKGEETSPSPDELFAQIMSFAKLSGGV